MVCVTGRRRAPFGRCVPATGCSFIGVWAAPASSDSEGSLGAPRPDLANAKLTVVVFAFLTTLEPPATLREIKESGLFADWSLVRQSRLSTMSAPAAFVEWMRKRYGKSKI
jgi:predicted RNA-binding protein with PUA-like domain